MVTANSLVKILRVAIGLLVAVMLLEVAALAVMPGLLSDEQKISLDFSTQTEDVISYQSSDDFQLSVEKTIFSWNRRPEAPESSEVEPTTEISSKWALSGVVNTGNATYAIFVEQKGERRLRLEEEMYLDRYKVTSITEEAVVLVSEDGDEEEFRLLEEDEQSSSVSQKAFRKTANRALVTLENEEN